MVLRNFSSSSGKHRILFSEIVEYPTSIEGSLTKIETNLTEIEGYPASIEAYSQR